MESQSIAGMKNQVMAAKSTGRILTGERDEALHERRVFRGIGLGVDDVDHVAVQRALRRNDELGTLGGRLLDAACHRIAEQGDVT